jgi:RNA polymerase sigma-32 factor
MTDTQESKKEEFIVTDHVPDLGIEESLNSYLRKIKNFPMLTAEEEYTLATQWKHHSDPRAKKRLIESHLRLISKIAQGYRGYGLPLADLIAEGHIGIMQALRGFDPDKGARFSTYSTHWVRAAIHEYVMRTWSLVKIGTTAAQKKLFFNLRRLKQFYVAQGHENLDPEHITSIAQELKVSEKEVREMDKRLSSADYSLNRVVGGDSDDEWQDWLADTQECHSEKLAHQEELQKRTALLTQALKSLKPIEQQILKARRLHEPPLTLEQLGIQLNLSRERIRQVEMSAFSKLQKNVRSQTFKSNISL